MKENLKLEPYGYVSDTTFGKTSKKASDFHFTMSEAASKLRIKGVGRNKLYSILKEMNFINHNNYAMDKFVGLGFFINESVHVECGMVNKVRVTTKGIQFLEEQLKNK